MNKITKLLLLASMGILFTMLTFNADAQKLPKVQKIAVRAPSDIKIDGNVAEWGDNFQAYNSSNYIYYTISNDDSNLYLTLKTEGSLSSRKFLRGGITFTVASISNKKSLVSITFPAVRKSSTAEIERLNDSPGRYKNFSIDTIANKNKIDSLILSSNRQIKNIFKDILVSGINEITEPLISIYNEQSIKVSVSFNHKMQLIYELAVPLRFLGNTAETIGKLKYNIKMNALATIAVPGHADPPTFTNLTDMKPEYFYLSYDNDFGAEYTLALK